MASRVKRLVTYEKCAVCVKVRHVTPAATLKALRKAAGLTQEQLADNAGLDRSWVNQMERGKRPIGPSPGAKLAKVLGVSPLELGAEVEGDPEYRPLLVRLEELEAEFEKDKRSRERGLGAVVERLGVVEAALGIRGRPPAPRGKEGSSP